MAYNFLRGDRDQPFLLPPDLRVWLPDGHLAWEEEVTQILREAAETDQAEDR